MYRLFKVGSAALAFCCTCEMASTLCFAQTTLDLAHDPELLAKNYQLPLSPSGNSENLPGSFSDIRNFLTASSAEDCFGLASYLHDHGYYPSLQLAQDLYASPTYGLRDTSMEHQQSVYGQLHVDLAKAFNIPDAWLHMRISNNYSRKNRNIGSQVGAYPFALVPPSYQRNKVIYFFYEQKLLDKRLTYNIGRKSVAAFFLDEFSGWDFASRSWGFANLVSPPFPSMWGASVKYQFTSAWYVKAGVHEYNTKLGPTNGWVWSTASSPGWTGLAEIGRHQGFADNRYPSHYELAFYNIHAPQNDPYYTEQGQSRAFNPKQSAQTHKDNKGLLLTAGKVIWRADNGPTAGNTPTAATVFGGIGNTLSNWTASGVNTDAYVGTSLLNPFGNSPNDAVGLKVEWTRLTSREQHWLEERNLAAGGTGYEQRRNTTSVQLFGQFNLTRNLSTQAFVMYGFNPNLAFNSSSTDTPTSGYAFGVNFTYNLTGLIGLGPP
ncbi:carbohydrate porin [Pseudomonas graminis]|uniref:carbohydrate porin n=1 Tax=Pseudomonas graminis TaxID=158627 RepID=UPI003C253239